MKKSITVVGRPIKYAYLIKDIDIDKVTIEKYDVECRGDIESSWNMSQGETNCPEYDDKSLEIILKDKVSNITLTARANVIEIATKMSGEIVRDIKLERTKKGKKVYLSDIELFKYPHKDNM